MAPRPDARSASRPTRSGERSLLAVLRGNLRTMLLMLLGAGLGIGLGQDARAQSQCKTGGVDVAAISQAEYDSLAAEAGAAACVTPRPSGVTLCQIPPLTSDVWTVVAEAPDGGGVAQSATQIEVFNGGTCLFEAWTPVESTDSRWIQATTSYAIPDNPPPLSFIAIVQIGPSDVTATVCPFGDGHDGKECKIWSGFGLR